MPVCASSARSIPVCVRGEHDNGWLEPMWKRLMKHVDKRGFLIKCNVECVAARAEVHLIRAFGSGTVRQGRCRRQGREGGLEVTVRKQQGRRMKHENGEGEMERHDMRTATTLSHACTRYLYATQGKCVRKMCVRHGVCVHPPVAHTVVATTWVRNPETKKKMFQTSSFHFHLDFSHQDVVHQFAFHRSSLVNASRSCASADSW